jgi:hypothetical protein
MRYYSCHNSHLLLALEARFNEASTTATVTTDSVPIIAAISGVSTQTTTTKTITKAVAIAIATSQITETTHEPASRAEVGLTCVALISKNLALVRSTKEPIKSIKTIC